MDWKNSLYLYNILVTREFQGSKRGEDASLKISRKFSEIS